MLNNYFRAMPGFERPGDIFENNLKKQLEVHVFEG
jgi:hypothetical protein